LSKHFSPLFAGSRKQRILNPLQALAEPAANVFTLRKDTRANWKIELENLPADDSMGAMKRQIFISTIPTGVPAGPICRPSHRFAVT
jgi:hypothetical protein